MSRKMDEKRKKNERDELESRRKEERRVSFVFRESFSFGGKTHVSTRLNSLLTEKRACLALIMQSGAPSF